MTRTPPPAAAPPTAPDRSSAHRHARPVYAPAMDDDALRRALAPLLADACVLRGTFTLRSGRTSSYYLDKYLFSTRPEVLRPLGELFARRIERMEHQAGAAAQRLAGAELGGIPLVTAAALATGRPCLFVRNARKDYGTSKQIEGAFQPGERVIVIEDVATTGGQALEAVATLRSAGLHVLGVIATIDREEGARENVLGAGVRFDTLFTRRDLGIDDPPV